MIIGCGLHSKLQTSRHITKQLERKAPAFTGAETYFNRTSR